MAFAALPAELSIALSKSAVDPYSVLGKRNQENMAAMAAEIEMLLVLNFFAAFYLQTMGLECLVVLNSKTFTLMAVVTMVYCQSRAR